MEYVFDQIITIPSQHSAYTAESKPRRDIMRILEKNGCVPIGLYESFNIPKLTSLNFVRRYLWMSLRIKKGDILYYQYPLMVSCLPYFLLLLSVLKEKGVILVCIIHDLDYLRLKESNKIKDYTNKFIKGISLSDITIAHTPAMKAHLQELGIKSEIRVLYLFDYLSLDGFCDSSYSKAHRNEIVFAGNLTKSKFLSELNNYKFSYAKFNLYGIDPQIDYNESVIYKGKFLSDNVSVIKGGWGLVWDGDSIETCSGLYGDYLRYNSPHKMSLYITAGIPVIVWSKSGLAGWILSNNLGIAINSLTELDGVLANIDDGTYGIIQNNARIFSEKLRNGKMILQVLNLY